ncbi:hypothetical protein [Virgibacillus salexigens]|uniref:Uncharacterized protein n=1 Tax=Virgibacillus kapii TaxID=1638645 RepID=A0ABQ2D779_9BACI|nr:hypothetical protein [Virgibacillus kapii]GGJ48599.1 hypothetical protein GCM10007111_08400 [Virgibacillus kapii]
MNGIVKFVAFTTIFAWLITGAWQIYEINVYGELHPNGFDTFITLILSMSLAGNCLIGDISKERK